MTTGIIGAMEQEVALLRDKIERRKTLLRSGCEIHTGQLHGVDVALVKSGIGKVAAATSATLLLEHCHPDKVINTGTAGGLSPELNVGDIVISDAVCYHDVDLTAFGYQPGQMAGCPAVFTPDTALILLAEHCIQQLQLTAVRGLICSGDSFINGALPRTRINTLFPTAVAVEMEAAAIGHVCQLFQIPFVVVRAVSDTADKKSHLSFEQFLSIAAAQSTLMVETMLQALNQ